MAHLSISLLFVICSTMAVALKKLETESPFEFDSSVERVILADRSAADLPDNGTLGHLDSPPGINPNDRIKLELKCQEPKEWGNGTQRMSRFYFDTTNSSCQRFEYSGDGGNDNNFPTELDCLNDCDIDVHEGEPVKEEDVILIGSSTDRLPAAREECLQPKETGNCSKRAVAVENYYFAPDWQSCLAFQYSGCGGNSNRFSSRVECEQSCLVADGSVCKGPHASMSPEVQGLSCADSRCAAGLVCVMGLRFLECCNQTEHTIIKNAYSNLCLDGSQAGGHLGDYFVATFASTCADLSCGPSERCEHPEGGFAKCCRRESKSRRNPNFHQAEPKQALPLAN